MPRRSNKQKHLDKAEIIGSYADALKKWKWLFWPLATSIAGSPVFKLIVKQISTLFLP
jgi:hypothetical protein